MNEPDPMRGGYPCPHPHCDRRFYIPDFLNDHLAKDHQEQP